MSVNHSIKCDEPECIERVDVQYVCLQCHDHFHMYRHILKHDTNHNIAHHNIIPFTHPANVFKGRTDDDQFKISCWDKYLVKQGK